MGKRRKGPRSVLGYVTTESGGRAEVRSSTIFNALMAGEKKIELLTNLLSESVAERKRVKDAFCQICDHPAVRLLARVGIVKLKDLESKVETATPARVTVEKRLSVGKSEVTAAAARAS